MCSAQSSVTALQFWDLLSHVVGAWEVKEVLSEDEHDIVETVTSINAACLDTPVRCRFVPFMRAGLRCGI